MCQYRMASRSSCSLWIRILAIEAAFAGFLSAVHWVELVSASIYVFLKQQFFLSSRLGCIFRARRLRSATRASVPSGASLPSAEQLALLIPRRKFLDVRLLTYHCAPQADVSHLFSRRPSEWRQRLGYIIRLRVRARRARELAAGPSDAAEHCIADYVLSARNIYTFSCLLLGGRAS